MTILAEGQLSDTQTTIYEVGAGIESSEIEKITFFNPSSESEIARLFVKARFGGARELRQFTLRATDGGEYLEPGEFLQLGNRDSLEAFTTTAATVDFVVFGEETRQGS